MPTQLYIHCTCPLDAQIFGGLVVGSSSQIFIHCACPLHAQISGGLVVDSTSQIFIHCACPLHAQMLSGWGLVLIWYLDCTLKLPRYCSSW